MISMLALVICITIHEFAHAFSAVRSGDDTPRLQGRISLNPLDHLDPMGTIMMVLSSLSGYGIGWGKPVMVNPANFNHPRWDNLRISLWGPLSNILTAAVMGTVLRFWGMSINLSALDFIFTLTLISIGLALFNLIPIAPLDGGHIITALLPYELAKKFSCFMARYGLFIFLGLIFMGQGILQHIIGPPAQFLLSLFLGPDGSKIIVRLFSI